jgi:hypothetical protein
MKIKNWVTCIQDGEKWKDVFEKATPIKGSSAPRRRRTAVNIILLSIEIQIQGIP